MSKLDDIRAAIKAHARAAEFEASEDEKLGALVTWKPWGISMAVPDDADPKVTLDLLLAGPWVMWGERPAQPW